MSDAASSDLKSRLKQAAAELSIDALAITRIGSGTAAVTAAGLRLKTFLEHGRHGDMAWMAANADKRANPSALWPQARSAIVVGQSYAPDHDPMLALADTHNAVVSVYAQGRDYHDVLKAKIRTLAEQFARDSGADVKIFIDTAPLMEKPLAAAAGLGWQGKHTNLVSRSHGSWLFLGVILTTADLPEDEPEADHCGSCSRCLDVCPTAAFPAPYQLDARRCLAYLSIEHKGHIAREFRRPMANRVFGCDDCLAVCPWNKFADAAREMQFLARGGSRTPPISELLALDDATFRQRFAGTPVKRTGRDRVVRNALIAAGNSGNTALLPQIEGLLTDPSSLVRAMAIWAVRRLADDTAAHRLQAATAPLETDATVAAEWSGTP